MLGDPSAQPIGGLADIASTTSSAQNDIDTVSGRTVKAMQDGENRVRCNSPKSVTRNNASTSGTPRAPARRETRPPVEAQGRQLPYSPQCVAQKDATNSLGAKVRENDMASVLEVLVTTGAVYPTKYLGVNHSPVNMRRMMRIRMQQPVTVRILEPDPIAEGEVGPLVDLQVQESQRGGAVLQIYTNVLVSCIKMTHKLSKC